jgi:hypothetical protein
VGKDSKLGIEGKWIVLVFILLFFCFLAYESQAAEVEIGPTNLSGRWSDGGTLLITERVNKWSFGGGIISEQYCHCTYPADIATNIFFQVQRVVDHKGWEIGVGPAYFQNTNRALGTNLNWALSIGYRWDDFSIRVRHYSNAGSGSPNLGQDLLTFGYIF